MYFIRPALFEEIFISIIVLVIIMYVTRTKPQAPLPEDWKHEFSDGTSIKFVDRVPEYDN